MSITLGDVILYLGADDSRLDGVLKKTESKAASWVNGLGSKLALGLGSMVTAAVGGAALLGVSAFKAGESLDTAFDTLLIKSGASGDALSQLQSDFKAVFTSVPTEAGPAAEVLSLVHQRLGLTGEGAQSATKRILEMSRMMGVDAVSSAESFTRMMKDAGLSSEDASLALDKVFVASQKTGIGVDRLMGLATQFGSPMRLMGFTLDDTIALLANWESQGVNTEIVMGSLRIAAGKFADEGKPLRQSLMESFDAIKNNEDATAALSKGIDVFGTKAGPDMVAAIREGRFNIDDMTAALQNADGAIDDTSKATMDWGEKLAILKNKATIALAPIGMKLMDVASVLLDKAGPALDKFAGILDTYLAPALDTIVASLNMLLAGDVAGALENLFGSEAAGKIMTFKNVVSDAFEILAAKIGPTFTQIFGKISSWFQENGPLIQQYIALIAQYFQEILMPAIIAFWGAVSPLLMGVVDLVLGIAKTVMQIATGDWPGAWETIKQTLVNAGLAIWNTIVGLLDTIAHLMGTSLAELGVMWGGIWDQFKFIVARKWELIVQGIKDKWAAIKQNVSDGVQAVKDSFTKTDWGSVGRNIIEGIARGITAGLSVIRDAAVRAASAALEGAKDWLLAHSPSERAATEVGEPIAEGVGVGLMRSFKGMGPMIGQGGVDAVTPLGSSGGAGGSVIHLTYNDNRFISTSDEFEAERILRPIIKRVLRSEGSTG